MPERLGFRLRTAYPCGVATEITGVRRGRNGLPLQARTPAALRESRAEAALIFLYHNTCRATRFLPDPNFPTQVVAQCVMKVPWESGSPAHISATRAIPAQGSTQARLLLPFRPTGNGSVSHFATRRRGSCPEDLTEARRLQIGLRQRGDVRGCYWLQEYLQLFQSCGDTLLMGRVGNSLHQEREIA